jgi:NADPH-dependent 2,4-dienoyl-CoA reductase/sulfur reductase-like enzyme
MRGQDADRNLNFIFRPATPDRSNQSPMNQTLQSKLIVVGAGGAGLVTAATAAMLGPECTGIWH